MGVVDGMHVGQSRGIGHMCKVKTLMTPVHTAVQVRSPGYGRAGIGRSSWKGLSTQRHEKAPVRCP